ncbi:hypothetical protein GN958_ATG22616, partial [Phytophthora infestans]
DLIIGHVRQKSTALAREAMLKGQKKKPAFKYEELLVTSCEVLRPMEYDEDPEKKRNYDWQMVALSDQDSYILKLEAHYGQSNAQGTVALITEFDEALAMDFASVGELIVRVKETRNRINRQSRENLKGVTMILNQYAAVKVLSLFPTQYWGNHVDYSNEGFHPDKVEALLRNVFMDTNRGQIDAMQAQTVPSKKKKGGECYYCDGRYNRDGESHYKADCPKRANDRSQGLMRNSIFVKGKRVDVPSNSVGVAHVKGEKKGKRKAKAKREEILADVALLQPISELNIVATVGATQSNGGSTVTAEQTKMDTDELMTSPPVSPTPPSSLSSSGMSDDEDDYENFVKGSVPAHTAK